MNIKIKYVALLLVFLSLTASRALTYGKEMAPKLRKMEHRGASRISLTLEQAINLALKANRTLLTSRYALESQKFSLKSAQSEFELKIVPGTTVGVSGSDSETKESVGLGVGLQKKFEVGTSLSVEPSINKNDEYKSGIGLSIEQPLLRGFGREVSLDGIRTAEFSTRRSERNLYQTMVNTVLETVSAVYQMIKQRELVSLNESHATRLRQHADAAMIKEKIGLATPMDVYRAEIRLKDVQDSLSTSKQDLQDAKDRLKIILVLPLKSDIDVSDPIKYTPIRLSPFKAIEIALESRVELEQADDEIRQAQRNARIAKHNILPELNFVLSYDRFGSSDDFDRSFRFDEARWGIQLVSSTDVSRTSEKAAYKQSMISVKTSRLNRAGKQDEIYSQVRTKMMALEAVEKRIEIRKSKVNQAEGKLSLAKIKFSYGMADNFDLIEAETEVLKSRVDLLSARIDYVTGTYSLRAALGTLIERKNGLSKY